MRTVTAAAQVTAVAACVFAVMSANCSDQPRTSTSPARDVAGAQQQASDASSPGLPPASLDPIDVYLASLPVTDADFPALNSEDARVWTEFFNRFGDNVSTLRAEVQRLEVDFGTATSALTAAEERLRVEGVRSHQATVGLERAASALRRVQQRSGGAASADVQREEERVERAREAREKARSEEDAVRMQVAALEARSSLARVQREETLTALERATRSLGAPALEAIASRELKLGNQVVTVIKHSRVDDRIGVAECDGRKPIIVIAHRPTHSLAYAGLLFFREHELAHHTLGHIDCSKGKSTRSGGPEQELEADCAAAKVLTSFSDGIRVVDIVFGHLYAWAFPASQTHPSTRARASALFTQCT